MAATAFLLVGSVAFRVPALANARSTNSDAAVVGLQAMHLLRGELSPFLWGSGYQTSADAFVAAAFFAVFGSTPLVLMASALALHVLATWLVFATLRARFAPWTALVATMPLVVSPSSVHSYALYPPRQLSITLAIAAFSVIDSAARKRERPALRIALGGALYGLAVSADPYPLVLAPIVLGYGLLVSLDRPRRRLPLLAVGAAAGSAPFLLLRALPRAKSGPMGLSIDVVAHNWDLLVQECLPWALSYKVYFARDVTRWVPWEAPLAVWLVQVAGALVAFGMVLFALGAAFTKRLSLEDRRLSFAAAMTYPVALGAFLVSVMVMDHFSMRYLVVLTVMLPFASVAAIRLLRSRRFALLLAPHLVASALCGWVGYGPFVRGVWPVGETAELRDDLALLELLRVRGITYAEADYWASYRLTLLSGERAVVVPTNPSEDRYPPYRRAFERAPTFAYVFDRGRSREDLAEAERALVRDNPRVERHVVGGLVVFFVERHESAPLPP